jgi:hypothetical protein
MPCNLVVNGKVVKKALEAKNYRTNDGSVLLFNENASTVGKNAEISGISAANRVSKLRPWEDTARGAAERAGHSSEALRRLRIAVRSQRQRLIDFARQHRRHLSLIEFKEYKQIQGAWIEASKALWQFEHPELPSPEFKLNRI